MIGILTSRFKFTRCYNSFNSYKLVMTKASTKKSFRLLIKRISKFYSSIFSISWMYS